MKNRWLQAGLVGVGAGLVLQSVPYALCLGLATLAISYELSARRARSRRNLVSKCWPEVLDSYTSAIASGLGTHEAFADLAQYGPGDTKATFAKAVDELDRGVSIDAVLDDLKRSFSEVYPDRLFELIRLVNQLGGARFVESLRAMAQQCRAEMSLDGEIAAKQGWIAGTAKLAIASPWIIVLLLSSRPENSMAYSSSGGLMILTAGLGVSLVAYRLIHALGKLPTRPRVFQ